MYMKTIYKKDTKGKLRLLNISTDESTLIQEAGLIDGKLTVHTSMCTGKNIGKKNETTDEEQAEFQAKALVIKKLKEGYFETQEEALNHINTMPMLAVTIDIKTLVYPVMVQPKLDGIRCIGTNKQKLSRKNRVLTTLDHIDLSSLDDDIILDGELYAHGLSFQENTKLIKKYRVGQTESIKYHVYDLPSSLKMFCERNIDLCTVTASLLRHNVELVPAYVVNNEIELFQYHKKFTSSGYEGTMVRTLGTQYEFNKRSKSLIKLKDFKDEEYEIVDVVPTEKIPTHGTIVCKMVNGSTFKCGNKLNHTEREELLTNKQHYIGGQAKVSYFEKTDSGIPRFPVFIGLRLEED